MTRKKPVVAIDGPAGSGKTTISRQAAQQLGYLVIDTGALYRTLALSTLRAGLNPEDAGFAPHCEQLVAENQIRLGADNEGQSKVWLSEANVSQEIRTPQMSERASVISAVPAVRAALLDLQRSLGKEGGVVVEGRDIGSVVFPRAEAKFFLTASAERRSERRYEQLQGMAVAPDLATVLQDVLDRDRRDSVRDIAPLCQAEDAELLDSTELSIDEVVAHIVARVRTLEAELDPGSPRA